MFCTNCGEKIDNTGKFCVSCGHHIAADFSDKKQAEPKNSYSKQKAKNENLHFASCQVCSAFGPIKYVEFYENKGALFMRFSREIKGYLCKNCITKIFWRFTLTTLFLGWWGVISFIITPFYILNNIGRYLMSLRLPKSEKLN